MRYHEIVNESDDIDDMIEDEADTRGDGVLLTVLEELRNRARGHSVPRIRVYSLVNLIKNTPGGEMFNAEALESARKSNDAVKNLIADIKDDENGVKYVYLSPVQDDFGDETGAGEVGGEKVGQTAPEKTVSSMANRALSSRS